MRFVKIVICCSLMLLAACAGNRSGNVPSSDYVEVPNPAMTLDPNATPTIWVPRSYVESGPPRGSELVKSGYEKAMGTSQVAPQKATPAMAPQQGGGGSPAQPVPQPVAAPVLVKGRIAVLETGENGLLQPFANKIRSAEFGVLIDPDQPAFLSKYATITNQAERGSFAVRLQQDYGATVTVFIAAPDTVAPGKALQGEIYDGMGGGLVRTVSAVIPPYAPSDAAARDAAVNRSLAEVTEKVREVVALLPWYGKVAAVDGDRAYINAGREAGLRVGQVLKVYHGGKVVPGLGFAPGERVATLEISGFVGTNGAYGVVKDGKGVQANDLVAGE